MKGETWFFDLYESLLIQLINKFTKCRDFDQQSFNRAQNLFSMIMSYKMNNSDNPRLFTSYSIIKQLIEASVYSETTGEKVEDFISDFAKKSIYHLCPRLDHINQMIKMLDNSIKHIKLGPILFDVLNVSFEECPETFAQEAGLQGFANLLKFESNPDAVKMIKLYVQQGRFDSQLEIDDCRQLEQIDDLKEVILEARYKNEIKQRIFGEKNILSDILLSKPL